MSNALSWHPDEETLLQFADQDLSEAEARHLEQHLAVCGECRGELEALRETLVEARRFHQTVLKPALPDAPRAWGRPRWSALAPPEARTRRVIAFPFKPAWAAAAAVVAAVVVVRWMERPIQVSAAELLRKAQVQEQAATPAVPRRIRIRWKNHSWTRPARLDTSLRAQGGDSAVLETMLQDAGFGWEDPLSAAAFAHWRSSLSERQDAVRSDPQSYVVTTSTPAGVLREASLTLRASDLHAVSATLRYRSDETLDMTEIPAETGDLQVAQPRPLPESAPRPAALPAPVVGPAEEVQVIAALHQIGADLGEPLQVERSANGILVSGTGLTASRQEQIQQALAGIPGVRVAFEAGGGRRLSGADLPRRTPPPADSADPLLEQLRAAAGNGPADPGDAVIDATDRTVQRAYALAALARRFPAPVESSFAAGDLASVRNIARDHLTALAGSIAELTALLTPVLPPAAAVPAATTNWQQTADSVVTAARDLDQALNAAAAGDLDARKMRLAATLARLRGLVEAARAQLQ